MKIIYACLLLNCLFAPLPAAAQAPSWPKPDDTITVQLSAEDYVTATTGKVVLSVNAALKDADAASTRKEILAGAQKIAKTNWRITSFNKSTDQAGLERWSAALEARLPEAQLTGMTNAAKSASRPGLQFTLNSTELSPTLEELEAGRAKLRETLLAKANEELARVNKNAGGRTYRIGAIEYGALGAAPMIMKNAPMMARMAEMNVQAGSMAADSGGSLAADQKIEMSATVMLATGVK